MTKLIYKNRTWLCFIETTEKIIIMAGETPYKALIKAKAEN
jgi:hypothetical protein